MPEDRQSCQTHYQECTEEEILSYSFEENYANCWNMSLTVSKTASGF